LRQLEHFVYRLGLLAGEGVIEDALIADVARAAGLELRARCDSRAPVGESLRGALELTRKQNGAWNKTRAALYLGWDPDTLVLRMREAGLELDGTVEAREPLERPEPPGTVQAAADRVGTAAEAAAPTKPNALF
jgi:DNA-binding NtrC family response regulator